MLFFMDVGGDNKPINKANWNKNKLKPGNQISRFTGSATLDSAFHNKVITSGTNQDGQIIALLEAIPSYIGTNQYLDRAKSFHRMERKLEAQFMPTAPRRRDYRTVDAAGVFNWRPDAFDREEDYKRDCKIWDKIFKLEVSVERLRQ